MCYKWIALTLLQVTLSQAFEFVVHPDRDLSMIEVLAKYGYPVEMHELVTHDGYVLTMHRIPRGKNNTSSGSHNKHPVILVHGTCGCSENFLLAGPGNAIVYYLADRGFDIWMLSTRGSRHSRKHLTLNPDTDKEFWNFGWHEIAVIDTPMAIDYILEATNNTKVFYIGHSQGSTSYFAFASDMQEYNNKIKVSVNMAPSCLLGDTRNVVKIMGKHSSLIQHICELFGIYELFPNRYTELLNSFVKMLCSEMTFFVDFCFAALYFGEIYGDMEKITPQLLFSKSPAHCSVRQLTHYFQIVDSGIFRQYDYGTEGNLKNYGTKLPPLYSFSNMTAPIALFYAPTDNLCPKKGVLKLAKLLPNLAKLYPVPSNRFGHIDFISGRRVGRLVNEQIYQLFIKYL